MIEAVSTSVVRAVAPKVATASGVSFSPAVRKFTPPGMGGLKIRIDVELDRAILEYRSGEGELIRQYPTESQIKAIQRSSEVAAKPELKVDTSSESADVPKLEIADSSDATAIKAEPVPSPEPSSVIV